MKEPKKGKDDEQAARENESEEVAAREEDHANSTQDPDLLENDSSTGNDALPSPPLSSQESTKEEAKVAKTPAAKEPPENTSMPRKIKSDTAGRGKKTFSDGSEEADKDFGETHSVSDAMNRNRSVRFSESAIANNSRQHQSAGKNILLSTSNNEQKHLIHHGEENSETSKELASEEGEVNLLQLVVQRSRGIYSDSGYGGTSSADHDEQHAEHDLVPDDSIRQSQLLHFNMGPLASAPSSAATTTATAATNGKESNETNEEKAAAILFQSNGSIIPPPPARGLHGESIGMTPGAYQGAPGRGFVRAEYFHGTLSYPNAGVYVSPMRGSGTTSTTDIEELRLASIEDHTPMPQPPDLLDYTTSGDVISAVRVNEESLQMRLTEEITNNAAQAKVVDLEKEAAIIVKSQLHQVRKRYACFATVMLVGIGFVILALVVGIRNARQDNGDSDDNIPHHPITTLQTILERGTLRCALATTDDNAQYPIAYKEDGIGFTSAFCKAVAAASLMGDVNVTVIIVTEDERWTGLENGSYDLLISGMPAMTESLNWDVDSDVSVAFSSPFFFDGVGAGGIPEYIERCANGTGTGFHNFLACESLKVCVAHGTAAYELAQQTLHPNQVVEVTVLADVYKKFGDGCCNVILTDSVTARIEQTVRDLGNYTGPYALGERLFTKQPWAIATKKSTYTDENATQLAREDDPQVFRDFVEWVVQALIAAEEQNITQATATDFPQTTVFGEQYKNMFSHAIAAVGNYGEIYATQFKTIVPRSGMNLLNNGSSGLHLHRSLGDVTEHGPGPYENMTLSTILKRGKLICGIPMSSNINFTAPEFSEMGYLLTLPPQPQFLTPDPLSFYAPMGGNRIDREYCRALTSSIFQGRFDIEDSESCGIHTHSFIDAERGSNRTLDYVLLWNISDGFAKLQSGEIDVVAGYRMDLQSDVHEATTGQGYAFSQPYFYGPTATERHVSENNRCVVTIQKDQQWSSFVQLLVSSLFYAEEKGITQATGNQMPVVNMFGPSFKRMFRDAIFGVGNYGEMYGRTTESSLPRDGTPNMLNSESGPQLAAMPGLWEGTN